MNLSIDIGNSRVKFGVFEGNLLLKKWQDDKIDLLKFKEDTTNLTLKNIILSTVKGEIDPGLILFLSKKYNFLQLSAATPLPIQNKYSTPETLGKDRLAAVVGAYALFPEKANLVIDAGTCITYDLIDQKGNYFGGNISPGIDMRLKAMHAFTANLPLAPRNDEFELLGNSTTTALQIGGQLGAIWEAETFINNCRATYGQINVILTGGDANFFAKRLKSKIFVNLDLVLIGLNKILDYNVEKFI